MALTIQGPWPLVQELKPEDLKAWVDTRNLAPGRHRLNVSISLPQGVTLVRLPPASVTASRQRPLISFPDSVSVACPAAA